MILLLSSTASSTKEDCRRIFGKVEYVDTDFLVDTGASVTVISESLF